MAGKTNAFMVRYSVEIDNQPIGSIISVAGFTLGTEGSIEVPEWDRNTKIANGKRDIQELSMKYRLMKDLNTHAYFKDWWDNRGSSNRTITVIWYNRGWGELFRWTFPDCEFFSYMGEDQELGQTKLGIIECKFYPYDATITASGPGATGTGGTPPTVI